MEQPTTVPENPTATAGPIMAHMEFVRLHVLHLNAVRFPKYDAVEEFSGPVNASDVVEVGWVPENRGAIAIVRLEVHSGEGDEQLFGFQADFRLIYHVKDSYAEDDIEERAIAFCKAYSLAHAWPYWRELLASLSIRMDLPTINAPLLIVGAKRSVEPKAVVSESPKP